jgi:hypothetical protein
MPNLFVAAEATRLNLLLKAQNLIASAAAI